MATFSSDPGVVFTYAVPDGEVTCDFSSGTFSTTDEAIAMQLRNSGFAETPDAPAPKAPKGGS